FAGLDPDLGARVGIDLPEEGGLDLPWEEAVLAVREGAGIGLVDISLREIGDEIPRHAHVEEELAGAPLPVEREGLTRPRQIRERGRRAAGRRLGGVADIGLAGGGLTRSRLTRRGGGGLSLQRLEAFGQRAHRLPHVLEVTAE